MNRHAIKWAILGATLIALMGPTGGFPSRPTFQSVTVNGNTTTGSLTTAGATSLQALTATNLSLSGTGSLVQVGTGSLNGAAKYQWWANYGVIDIGGVGSISADTNGIALADNLYVPLSTGAWTYKAAPNAPGAAFTMNAGVFSWLASVSGPAGQPAYPVTVMSLSNAGVLNVRGVDVPKVSYATCAAAGGFGTGAHGNVASCVRNSVGNYTVNFSVAYSTPPACVQSLAANSGFAYGGSVAGSATTVGTASAAAAATDLSFSVSCFGT